MTRVFAASQIWRTESRRHQEAGLLAQLSARPLDPSLDGGDLPDLILAANVPLPFAPFAERGNCREWPVMERGRKYFPICDQLV